MQHLNNEEYYSIIRKASDNNKLVIFVGAGVSMNSGLPSWGQLIGDLKKSVEVNDENFLKIAEYYFNQYGRNAYYQKLEQYFPSKESNELHKLILDLKPQHIITTNWDDLLEKAILQNADLYFTVATDQQLASSPRHQLLVKMHGDLYHRNIVFKETDYHAYSDNFPLIENFVKSLFSTHTVLFIGYSINDYNLNLILSWIKNRTQDAPQHIRL
jgi:NAD-dependent SIR2 family protein deacetylase